jgi:hypothetical protein
MEEAEGAEEAQDTDKPYGSSEEDEGEPSDAEDEADEDESQVKPPPPSMFKPKKRKFDL